MPEPGQLSVNDRVLLHISRFATDVQPEEYLPDCTQAGIALAVGISRTHVPRAVRGLVKEGLVTEITARVRGHERRMSVYTVTMDGMRAAEGIWEKVRSQNLPVKKDGSVVQMNGSKLEELVGRRRAIAAVSQMRNGIVSVDERRRSPVQDLASAPKLDRFYGREAELSRMEEFMDSKAGTLVILGNKGYGTTSLTRRFVDAKDDLDVLWENLDEGSKAADLEKRLLDFGQKIDSKVDQVKKVLGMSSALLVFDGYFTVPEEVVEFFAWLVESLDGAKVIINARQETPAYNWFYQKKHVDSGLVQELRIKGLDASSARKLLGNDRIEQDAFRRIMMMTHGQPMVLRMLSEGDQKGLRRNTLFTPEEIRYLLFLKDKEERA